MTLRCVHISSVPERGCSQMNRGRTPLPYLLKWREDTFPLDEMGICSVLWGADLYRQWGSCQQPPRSRNITGPSPWCASSFLTHERAGDSFQRRVFLSPCGRGRCHRAFSSHRRVYNVSLKVVCFLLSSHLNFPSCPLPAGSGHV